MSVDYSERDDELRTACGGGFTGSNVNNDPATLDLYPTLRANKYCGGGGVGTLHGRNWYIRSS